MEAPIPLPSQLRLAVLRLSRRLRQQAVGEVTASQLSALQAISKHGEVTLGELAAIERVAPPSMTRIAARLEERGLVVRRADRADRRVARVAVTDTGRAILDETRTRRDAYLAARLQSLSAEDQELLARAVPILERLVAAEPPDGPPLDAPPLGAPPLGAPPLDAPPLDARSTEGPSADEPSADVPVPGPAPALDGGPG
jgi:DNA-binding MarR family transcriptional regulator